MYCVCVLTIVFTRPLLFSTIETIITSFGSHLNVELQQRGIEFTQLFRQHAHLRPALLEKMPAMQKASNRNNNNSPDGENGGIGDSTVATNLLDESETTLKPPPSVGADSVRADCVGR